MSVTIVIPVYNEAQSLPPLVEGIERHAADVPHRILLVDDGSTDGSWACMLKLRETRQNLDAIRLRRNFGKTRSEERRVGKEWRSRRSPDH